MTAAQGREQAFATLEKRLEGAVPVRLLRVFRECDASVLSVMTVCSVLSIQVAKLMGVSQADYLAAVNAVWKQQSN